MNPYIEIYKKYYPNVVTTSEFPVIAAMCENFALNNNNFFDELTVVKLIPLIINSQSQFMAENKKVALDFNKKLEWALLPGSELDVETLSDIYNFSLYPADYDNRFTQGLDALIEYIVVAEVAKDGVQPESAEDIEEAYAIAEAIICQAILFFRSFVKILEQDNKPKVKTRGRLH